MEHRAKKGADDSTAPQWIARPLDGPATQYWDRAVTAAKSAGGRVAYRPGGRDSLGSIGGSKLDESSSALPPRWTATNTPKMWTELQAKA